MGEQDDVELLMLLMGMVIVSITLFTHIHDMRIHKKGTAHPPLQSKKVQYIVIMNLWANIIFSNHLSLLFMR